MSALVVDVEVRDSGTILLVAPVSDDARRWTAQNVHYPESARYGCCFVAERRCALAILERMEAEGFNISPAPD